MDYSSFRIDRVDFLSKEDFITKYLIPRIPVIVTNAFKEVPACGKWNFEFFRTKYGQTRVKVAIEGRIYFYMAYMD
jgi:hypothetical protein